MSFHDPPKAVRKSAQASPVTPAICASVTNAPPPVMAATAFREIDQVGPAAQGEEFVHGCFLPAPPALAGTRGPAGEGERRAQIGGERTAKFGLDETEFFDHGEGGVESFRVPRGGG